MSKHYLKHKRKVKSSKEFLDEQTDGGFMEVPKVTKKYDQKK